MVVGKAGLVTYKGPTMIASTLHGIALFLKWTTDLDWFVSLMSQDGEFLFLFLFAVKSLLLFLAF